MRRIALALALLLTVSACAPRQTRDQIASNEERIAALEAALFEATSTTTTTPTPTPPASDTVTDVTVLDLPESVEPVAVIAATVGPAVVQIETGTAIGAGVLYSTDGLILTAHHVVEGETDVMVRLFDGRIVDGTVLGFDAVTDIAVVEIPASPDLPVASLALESPTRVGQLAVALGSPFGFDQTVTAGIVSAVDRVVRGVTMVQTDAAINPGNSGGPLLNAAGEVVGVNTAIAGNAQSVGFAISVETVKGFVERYRLGIGEPFLGVTLGDNSPAAAERLDLAEETGALITEVVPSSPASEAGLQRWDVIVGYGAGEVGSAADLITALLDSDPGDVVQLSVVRGRDRMALEVTVGEWPEGT